jgi:hypothetical protein
MLRSPTKATSQAHTYSYDTPLEEANPGHSVPPKQSVLTRVDRLPVYAMG